MSRDELARIQFGPEPGQPLDGMGSVRFWASCRGNSEEVLGKAKEALSAVVTNARNPWPTDEEWALLLPAWFVSTCRPPYTKEEVELSQQASYEEKLRRARERTESWPMDSWVHWFRPENRNWFWWDAVASSPDRIVIAVTVTEWPFPWGSLDWLFRAAGSVRLETEE